MLDLQRLHAQRLACWRQTPETRLPNAAQAPDLIQHVGIATLYPVSPEIPNLFHAFMGDPDAPTDSAWDSPSGQVYSWRWVLGRQEAAFYTALVRGKPTWIGWELLPAVMRLCGELRTPDELYDMGKLSADAYRIAQALENADGGTLSTGELRKAAGFPTGKPQRAAYLKAVQELDTRLLLAKVFAADGEGDDMSHALVATRYPQYIAAAEQLSTEEALEQLLLAYLPAAVYAVPTILARHLKIAENTLRAGLDRLVAAERAEIATFPDYKGACYVWREEQC